jgi:cyanophycin synthetase
VGDRRDKDIISLGAEAARIFDEIIVRQDKNLRGRSADELNGLLYRGIRTVDPYKKTALVPDEHEAVLAVLETAQPGMVATVFADDIDAVIAQLQDAVASRKYFIQQVKVA